MIQIPIEILGIFFLVLTAVIGWAWKLQSQINKLETEIVINTTKDNSRNDSVNKDIDSIKSDINEMKADVRQILDYISGEKALKGKK